jgi:hypothetical protein
MLKKRVSSTAGIPAVLFVTEDLRESATLSKDHPAD